MELGTRIAQSQVRVKSGIGGVMLFLSLALIAYMANHPFLAEICGWIAGIFVLSAAVEFWNVRRLRKTQ